MHYFYFIYLLNDGFVSCVMFEAITKQATINEAMSLEFTFVMYTYFNLQVKNQAYNREEKN